MTTVAENLTRAADYAASRPTTSSAVTVAWGMLHHADGETMTVSFRTWAVALGYEGQLTDLGQYIRRTCDTAADVAAGLRRAAELAGPMP